MITRYWELGFAVLLILVLLMTPFASGISIAGMFLIFFFLLILRMFLLNFLKSCEKAAKFEKNVRNLYVSDKSRKAVMEAEYLLEKANEKKRYELKSIILAVLFIVIWIFSVDWSDLLTNFQNWFNN